MAKTTKAEKTKKHAGGRPTKYKPENAPVAQYACGLGYTDKRLAEMFHVTQRTIDNWKRDYPEFFQSLQKGKDIIDDSVEKSLFLRAMGYSVPEVHILANGDTIPIIKHYPPDPTSMIFWLKNRRSKKWRDKHDLEHSGSVVVPGLRIVAPGDSKDG